MTRLVELEADNPYTLGRAYCCGVSNAGVFEPRADAVAAVEEMSRATERNATSRLAFQRTAPARRKNLGRKRRANDGPANRRTRRRTTNPPPNR